MNRTRIYARVSGDRQKRDGTIANQVGPSVLKDLARQGLESTGIIYTDDGKSASAGKLHLRGDFHRMLADAAKGEFDVLWVADLDRITRSNDWGELGQIFGPLQKAGIKLAGPNLAPMDLGNSMSMMQIMMKIIVAYEDNQKRVERFQIGKREAARKGCHAFGRVPYGLTWRLGARDASGWGVNEDQARIVREIYKRVLAGESGHMVARSLESRGEPTKRGGRWFDPVTRILRLTVYRGETEYCGIPVKLPESCKLVSDDDWYKVQAILGTSKKRGLVQTRHEYLCEGLGTCASCGSPMYVRTAENKFHYYVCRDRTDVRKSMSARCQLPRFRTDTIDASVWGVIAEYLSQPRAKILATLRGHRDEAAQEASAWGEDVKRFEGQLAAMQAAEEMVQEELERGMITRAAFIEGNAKRTVRRRALQEQLRLAQEALQAQGSHAGAAQELEGMVDELRELAQGASFQEQRAILKGHVRLRFDERGAHVKFNFAQGSDGGEIGKMSKLPSMESVTLRVVA